MNSNSGEYKLNNAYIESDEEKLLKQLSKMIDLRVDHKIKEAIGTPTQSPHR